VILDFIFDFRLGGRRVTPVSSKKMSGDYSDNQKPVLSFVEGSAIQNPTWLSIAIVLTLLFGVAAAPAQQPKNIPRIGYLDPSTASGSAVLVEAFRQELSKLGWIEGKNIAIDYRYAEQKAERLAELAAELVRLKVDLIVASSPPSALAVKKATTTIPIVLTGGDLVGLGLVASLARPGGNITGVSSLAPELGTKRLEILKDVVPKLARVGILWWSGARTLQVQLKEFRSVALVLNLKLEEIESAADAKSLETAFQGARQKQMDAILLACSASLPTTSTKSSMAPERPICLCSRQPSLNSSSISRRQRRSV